MQADDFSTKTTALTRVPFGRHDQAMAWHECCEHRHRTSGRIMTQDLESVSHPRQQHTQPGRPDEVHDVVMADKNV